MLTENRALVLECEVLVVLAVASLASSAETHEETNQLVDLVGVNVIGKRERSQANADLVTHCSAEPLRVEQLLKDRVESQAVSTQVVLEELDLDLLRVATLNPTWVSSEDGDAVSGTDSSKTGRSKGRFHGVKL